MTAASRGRWVDCVIGSECSKDGWILTLEE
jgi:hypothetical protein